MDSQLKVIINDIDKNPYCQHGPTLLFRKTFSCGKFEEYFACSACRDRKTCSFYLKVNNLSNQLNSNKNKVPQIDHKKLDVKLREKILRVEKNMRAYCFTCQELITDKEFDVHFNHKVKYNITNDLLNEPTKLLNPLSNDKKEAQYYFSNTTLQFLVKSFQSLNFTKIICIGAPRLHEYLKTKRNISSILLDFDQRFHSFYGPNEFCWYNMFNNHFFGGEESKQHFTDFLIMRENENICLFTDPPFGCRTEPLVETIKKIAFNYQRLNRTKNILSVMWIFPYFMENYIVNTMPEMEMLDYKINYLNHELYSDGEKGRKQGSPVRIFTNVDYSHIKFPMKEGYKYCKKCTRWISIETKHCTKCDKCLSKNGDKYVHCNLCELCRKPNYVHCNLCGRCTQIMNHNCKIYQMNLICWICRRKGHTEKQCFEWFKYSKKNLTQKFKTKRRICLICSKNGHNEKNCPSREILLKETCFLGNYKNLFLQ